MFHINNKGESGVCRAKQPSNCRFYKGEDDSRHYETVHEAEAAAQEILKKEYGNGTEPLRKRKNYAEKYSFLKLFKEKEDEYKKVFGSIPKRFINADLRGKAIPAGLSPDEAVVAHFFLGERPKNFPEDLFESGKRHAKAYYNRVSSSEMLKRMTMVLSEPTDAKRSEEEIMKSAEKMGIQDLQKMENFSYKTPNSWMGKLNGKQVVITGDPYYKSFESYRFRYGSRPDLEDRNFSTINTRHLFGLERLTEQTGENYLSSFVGTESKYGTELKRDLFVAFGKLEKLQGKGKDFVQYKKYMKDLSATTATVWMDKKNPDKVHLDLAKNSKLNKMFRKIEIDNDVDPAEFVDFEKEIMDTLPKLPKIPDDRKPELRVRKLGRHKANGIYFPHKNTVAVDVRTSAAFVHEMGHYYDIAVKENASLSEKFSTLGNEYSRLLNPIEAGNKFEYYTTKTEIFARGWEMYCHEKLGIDNRLLNPENFERFDYEPFQKSEWLKEQTFRFFDSVFDEKDD